ncbi:MAG: hypothetical protein ACREK8_00920 [Gemmatimonadales bacterium]
MLARCLSCCAVLISLAFPLAAQASHPDFSGTWVLDASKTVVDGQMEAPSAVTFTVVQLGDSLSIDEKVTGSWGEQALKKVWKVDGKVWPSSFSYGGVPMTLSTTLHWNGAVLMMHTTSDYQGNAVEQSETWTLSPDGKTLTDTTSTSANGDYYSSVTLVLNKQ